MEYFEVERDIEDFLNNKIAVNCLTEKDAREFLDFLISEHQIKWQDTYDINERTYWNFFEENTNYRVSNLLLNYCYNGRGHDYKVFIYKSIESKLRPEQKINSNSNKKRKIIILNDFNLFT